MIEIIFIIIIYLTVIKISKRAKENGGSLKKSISLPNTAVTASYQQNNNAAKPTVQQPRTVQTSRKTIQEAKEDGHSTTAYLMEKAEADAREHAKEKYEEQKRLYETRGGLAVAERYLDGDTIPNGKRCINCGYCGAENLIPMIPRTKYSCYFCREPLN